MRNPYNSKRPRLECFAALRGRLNNPWRVLRPCTLLHTSDTTTRTMNLRRRDTGRAGVLRVVGGGSAPTRAMRGLSERIEIRRFRCHSPGCRQVWSVLPSYLPWRCPPLALIPAYGTVHKSGEVSRLSIAATAGVALSCLVSMPEALNRKVVSPLNGVPPDSRENSDSLPSQGSKCGSDVRHRRGDCGSALLSTTGQDLCRCSRGDRGQRDHRIPLGGRRAMVLPSPLSMWPVRCWSSPRQSHFPQNFSQETGHGPSPGSCDKCALKRFRDCWNSASWPSAWRYSPSNCAL